MTKILSYDEFADRMNNTDNVPLECAIVMYEIFPFINMEEAIADSEAYIKTLKGTFDEQTLCHIMTGFATGYIRHMMRQLEHSKKD